MMAIAQELFPSALQDHHDAGSIERCGAQFEEKIGSIPPQYARDLRDVAADFLGHDGQGNAQRRLSISVFGIKSGAPADQEFDDIIQSLIGGRVQRGPAELSDAVHVGGPIHEEFHGRERRLPFFSPRRFRPRPPASAASYPARWG